MSRVLLAGSGTFASWNAGDEALFAALVEELRRIEPGVHIALISANPPGSLAAYEIEEIWVHDLLTILDRAEQADLLILGGGGLFQDYWGARPDEVLTYDADGLELFTTFALLATLQRKPLMIHGVGVGPLSTEEGRSLTRTIFDQAAISTLRDPGSRSLLQELGVDGGRLVVAADPVFALDWADTTLDLSGRYQLPQPIVAVTARGWDVGVAPARWERELAKALGEFAQANRASLLFVPFHGASPGLAIADDRAAARRIAALLPAAVPFRLADEGLSARELAAHVASADLLVAMRLHSLIFAARAGVPSVGISYDAKVSELMKNLQSIDFLQELSSLDAGQLLEMMNRAWSQRASLSSRLRARSEELARHAARNTRLLSEFMAGQHDAPAVSATTLALLSRLLLRQSRNLANATFALRQEQERRQSEERAHLPKAGSPAAIGAAIQGARAERGKDVTPAPTRPPARRPRVAYLTYMLLDMQTRVPRFGGGERYALTLARFLREQGFEVTFYQAAIQPFEGEYYGFPVKALALGHSISEFQLDVSNEFHDLTLEYDHVIYNVPEFAAGRIREDALLICHGLWFDHDNYPPPTAYRTAEWFACLYRVMSRPRCVVSVDTNSINVLRSYWPEVAPGMTYIPNWVDLELFRPSPRSNERLIVLFPRRSQVNRGSRILGQILSLVPHDVIFRWVGEGEAEETAVVREVARNDSRLSVHAATFEEMPQHYREADLCVLPTVGSEGLSLSALEALASGCAVVSTNVGGLPNAIHHEVNGLLVNPDPREIAAAINLLIDDVSLRERLQREGVESAEYFSAERWKKRWLTLLHELKWTGQAP